MANILISSLGTGIKDKNQGYKTTIYEYDNKTYKSSFISKVLTNFLQIDKLFLVGTNGSIWDSCYAQFGGKDEKIELMLYEKTSERTLTNSDLEILNQTISSYLKNQGSKCFLINYGLNEDELWSNFDKYLKILDEIKDGDILYLDISHAFRSLALMSFLMVQFGHIIKDKKFKIGGIFYGMLEFARENNGVTPIIDLKLFYDLLEWIKAVENFKNYANGDLIASLLQNSNKEEYNIFNDYTNAMRIANMTSIQKNILLISTKIKQLQNSKNPIIALMSDEMKSFINRLLKPKLSDFQLELASWYCEHKHYALSYIALVEAIVTKVCEEKKYNIENKKHREQAKKEISQINSDLYFKIYRDVNQIRNAIAHQKSGREQFINRDIKNLQIYIKETKAIFQCLS